MSLSKTMRERRAAHQDALTALLAAAEARNDGTMTEDESTKFDSLVSEIRKADARLVQLDELEASQAKADEVRKEAGTPVETHVAPATVTEPQVYARGNVQRSYFKDLAAATLAGSGEARDRLVRNSKMVADEVRALGNTSGVGGSGGEFAPPLWLVNEFVALARPGRVFAGLVNNKALPEGVATINLPRILTGTTTAIQTTQNTALSQTDMTTGAVSAGITTIGGKQVVAQQLLDQSAIPFDEVIMADLAADYARQLDVQFILGSGAAGQLRGVVNGVSVGSTVYTQVTPAVAGAGGLYATIAKAIAAVETSRFLPPTAIVMHPRRWGFIAASFDSNNRPLLPMSGVAMNPVGDQAGGPREQGPVGVMQGLPVYTDANIPTNLGTGANEDRVFVLRVEDLFLYESALRMESFTAPYADTAGVLFRALAYSAAIPDRYGASTNIISGTGLVTPVY